MEIGGGRDFALYCKKWLLYSMSYFWPRIALFCPVWSINAFSGFIDDEEEAITDSFWHTMPSNFPFMWSVIALFAARNCLTAQFLAGLCFQNQLEEMCFQAKANQI